MIRTAVQSIRRFIFSDEGPTAIEYAVMLSLVIVVCVWSIQVIGNQTAAAFQRVGDVIQN